MNNDVQKDGAEDLLELAERALRTRGAGEAVPAEVVAGAVRACEQARVTLLKPERRFWTMRKIFGTTVAGGIAAGLVVMWVVLQTGTRMAFAEVLENLHQVKSVKMKMHSEVEIGGILAVSDGMMYIDETTRRMRQELNGTSGDHINIYDFNANKGVSLTPQSKTAILMDISHMPARSFLEKLRDMPAAGAKDVGEKEIGGRKLHGFYLVEKEGETTTELTVWVDGASKMPVVVEQKVRNGFLPMNVTMTDFEWDVAMEEELLKVEVPAGYVVSAAPFDMGKPAEKEVVAALKASVVFNGGRFPVGLRMKDLGMSMYMSLPAGERKDTEQKMREHAGELLVVARGWAFISDPANGGEWKWAGTGVAFGEKGVPVMWYKAKGKDVWTVFDADLRVHEEKEEPAGESQVMDTTGVEKVGG